MAHLECTRSSEIPPIWWNESLIEVPHRNQHGANPLSSPHPHFSLADISFLFYSAPMRSRRNILHNRCFAHVYYRCHNREMLLSPQEVKDYIILTLAKCKKKYGELPLEKRTDDLSCFFCHMTRMKASGRNIT